MQALKLSRSIRPAARRAPSGSAHVREEASDDGAEEQRAAYRRGAKHERPGVVEPRFENEQEPDRRDRRSGPRPGSKDDPQEPPAPTGAAYA